MESLYRIRYDARDRLLSSWEKAMELVRAFETFSRETEEPEVAETFAEFAEDEALIAAKLFELLKKYDK